MTEQAISCIFIVGFDLKRFQKSPDRPDDLLTLFVFDQTVFNRNDPVCLRFIGSGYDISLSVSVGDGAGAAVICAEEGEIFPAVTHSDGAKGQVLACESRQQKNWQDKENEKQTYVSMDGQAVFKFAVKKVPEVIGELLQKADLTEKDIDLFVLHQANLRIIESVAKRMKTDLAKFPVNIEEYGNTSSASIPILLDELNKTGRFHKGQKIVLCGFGAGLTWGATLIEW